MENSVKLRFVLLAATADLLTEDFPFIQNVAEKLFLLLMFTVAIYYQGTSRNNPDCPYSFIIDLLYVCV